MRLIIKQCKHCGTRYTYQASGDGCFDRYNNREYCPDCYRAMMMALDKIPKKYHPQYKEVEIDNTIIEALERMKKEYDDKILSNKLLVPVRKLVGHNGDEFIYKGNHYIYSDGKLFLLSEFDANGVPTDNAWIEDDCGGDRYIPTQGITLGIEKTKVMERKLSPPLGKVFFNYQLSVTNEPMITNGDAMELSKFVRPYKS